MTTMSAAHTSESRTQLGQKSVNIQAAFSTHAMNSADIHAITNQTTANINAESFDTFDLSPWQLSLRERFTNMIATGQHGVALDLLQKNLDIDPKATMEALDSALNLLQHAGFSPEVSQFSNLLTHSGLIPTLQPKAPIHTPAPPMPMAA